MTTVSDFTYPSLAAARNAHDGELDELRRENARLIAAIRQSTADRSDLIVRCAALQRENDELRAQNDELMREARRGWELAGKLEDEREEARAGVLA